MEDKVVRVHVYIEGRVQGVFYRDWTARAAQGFQLTGWVRNLADGRVEMVFEGPKQAIQNILAECKKGSRLASVKHLDVIWEDATGEFKNFEIVA